MYDEVGCGPGFTQGRFDRVRAGQRRLASALLSRELHGMVYLQVDGQKLFA